MTIINATIDDIEAIFKLYKYASEYQKSKKTVVVWPDFDRNMVENELLEERQWKLLIDGHIACVWAIAFSDPQIWGEKDKNDAIYIHRIATNPEFRGQDFVRKIVFWAKDYASLNGKRYVRLDTIGNNPKLFQHYQNAGFEFLGMFALENTDQLPAHYKEADDALFEIDLEQKS